MSKYIFLVFLSIFLVGCSASPENEQANSKNEQTDSTENSTIESNKDDEDTNTLDKGIDITESLYTETPETSGSWITYDGNLIEDSTFSISTSLEYNPNESYYINVPSYITYFNDGEFLKTVQYSSDFPIKLQVIKNANEIKISYRESDL